MLVPPSRHAYYHVTIRLPKTDGDDIRVTTAVAVSGLRTPAPSNSIASVYPFEQPSKRGYRKNLSMMAVGHLEYPNCGFGEGFNGWHVEKQSMEHRFLK